MPEKATIQRARRKKRRGDSEGTAAGEFVREEVHHIREGKHGARSTKQAIAIGLSKARRAGVKVPPPRKGTTSARTRRAARKELETARRHPKRKPSPRRARAATTALRREGHAAGSSRALSAQAKKAAARKTHAQRSASARKAAKTRQRHAR